MFDPGPQQYRDRVRCPDAVTELIVIDLLVRTLGQRDTGSAKQLTTIVPGGLPGTLEGERCVPLAGERESLLDLGVNVPVGVVDDGEFDVLERGLSTGSIS